ncbi:Hypothetical protein LUCI_4037 [Lucifera butyrica]|uniref:GRAM domain-containing protein n=1 Tax=Lucifera butyrica TaxID=1351585 RepID=A0A498R7L7_9FIRM|nr:GRAM domain-containing protein [Lucifera butyrica]VBB08756.1 Hypothetical protein LUCI_4037 [Lucifera butyrica]
MYSFSMEENERILKKGMASLECEESTFNGALYLTTDRLVFVGYMLNLSRKYILSLSLVHIRELKAAKTFFILPNVLIVTSIRHEDKFKFIMGQRDEWLQDITRQMDRIQ